MAFGPPLPRRHLVGFDPMALPHHFTDVLVLGGGIAGMRTALGIPPELRVLIITKQAIEESNTAYAQGGIAGVLDPEDALEDHIADTLAAGKGLCDPQAVELVVREGPDRIRELIDWGTHFDQNNGRIDLTREGGHSHARIAHALGDATGRELTRALIANVRGLRHVRIWQNSLTIDILTHQGRCRGALVWDAKRGPSLVWCRAILLATGGAGQLYRESTNPPLATGDGHAMAYRAGAELRDMEFMQFHPTVLYIAGSARFLLTEALRGEGAYLRDRKGVRFMPEAHPAAELAPRDDVSRAITRRMAQTRHPCVYLDLSHLDAVYLRNRFPGIDAICRRFDLDFTKDPIPVRPGAHYMLGGVSVDLNGRTTLPGLWAAGEVTSSGLHGANRLASNSLLEGLVFGARAAEDIAAELARSPRGPLIVPSVDGLDPLHVREVQPASPGFGPNDPTPADSPGPDLDLTDIRESLRALMGREVGIARDAEGLQEARRQVEFWCRYVLPIVFDGPEGWTLQNMLTVAQLMIASALEREESRGVHHRTDFPAPSDAWLKRVTLRRPLLEDEAATTTWATSNVGSEVSSLTPVPAAPEGAGTPATL